MKYFLLTIIALISSHIVTGQNGNPYAVWEDQAAGGYYFVQLDASTGVKTNIAVIPGMTAFVAGNKSAFNYDLNYYHCAGIDNGQTRYYTIDASNGMVVSNPVLNDNLVGIEYNCNDSILYSLREVSNSYDLVSLDPITGIVTSIAPITNITGYVTGTFAIDYINSHYIFVAFNNGSLTLRAYDLYSGIKVYDNPFTDNLTGYRYSCSDSALYGLWENNNQYLLERITPSNGTHNTVNILGGVVAGIIAESSSINQQGVYTYRGFDATNAIALINIDVSNGMVLGTIQTQDNAVGFEEGVCCYDTSGATVSINEIDGISKIHVYPNPNKGTFFITYSLPQHQSGFLEILDTSGRIIYAQKLPPWSTLQQIQLPSNISKGVYNCSFSNASFRINKRIVILPE
jgi:type IX secretion system substrate protein